MSLVLIDAGPIVAYYNQKDSQHKLAMRFLESFRGQLLTSEAVVTEAMWLTKYNRMAQVEFLLDLSRGLYLIEPLSCADYPRIAALNRKYADAEPDYADLTLIAISERLDIRQIATFDSEFGFYRRFKSGKFEHVI